MCVVGSGRGNAGWEGVYCTATPRRCMCRLHACVHMNAHVCARVCASSEPVCNPFVHLGRRLFYRRAVVLVGGIATAIDHWKCGSHDDAECNMMNHESPPTLLRPYVSAAVSCPACFRMKLKRLFSGRARAKASWARAARVSLTKRPRSNCCFPIKAVP